MSSEPKSETDRGRPKVSLTVLVLLALAVWCVAVWHRGGGPKPGPPGSLQVETGTVAQLFPAIHRGPRAVVYVGCPTSTYSVHARQWFLSAAASITSNVGTGRIQFFVIDDEMAEDAQAWAASFRDERLANFGHVGYGWVLWLEDGQLREVEPYAGYPGRSPEDIVKHTRNVWP